MLVELGLVEQRFQAVLEVLNEGAAVTDVARRYGVARQTVHDWLGRYAAEGLRGLADRSSRPLLCPHQMPPVMLRQESDSSGAPELDTTSQTPRRQRCRSASCRGRSGRADSAS
jgi:transposase-like protein